MIHMKQGETLLHGKKGERGEKVNVRRIDYACYQPGKHMFLYIIKSEYLLKLSVVYGDSFIVD